MDRASAFADDQTVELLKTKYVPVAVSLQEDLKSRDSAGEFFRKVAHQRAEPKHSKQGYYIVAADGKLLKGWMYPRPDDGTMKRNLTEAAASYVAPEASPAPVEAPVKRPVERTLPAGAAVVEATTRITDAEWPAGGLPRFEVLRGLMGHDRLWILKGEVDALGQGTVPKSLVDRLVRFNLGDNTRCIFHAWAPDAVREARAELKQAGSGFVLEGSVRIEKDNKGYEARLYGHVEVSDGRLKRFDLVAHGKAWGRQNAVPYVPAGKFTLTVAFTLAKPGASFETLPVHNWVNDYLRAP